jgi:hypothetical protein
VPVVTRSEWLDIDGTPLATPAWEVPAGGLLGLIQGPDVRGSDRLIPGVAGVRRYKRRATVSKRSVPLVIWGTFDLEGVAHADHAEGLVANIDYLRANVADPIGTGDGTRTATLHLKDGSTRTGPVHVETMELGGDSEDAYVRAVLNLSLPLGALA